MLFWIHFYLEWSFLSRGTTRVHLYCSESECDIISRCVRESNLMLALRSDKNQKEQYASAFAVLQCKWTTKLRCACFLAVMWCPPYISWHLPTSVLVWEDLERIQMYLPLALGFCWWLSQIWISSHIFRPRNPKLARTKT